MGLFDDVISGLTDTIKNTNAAINDTLTLQNSDAIKLTNNSANFADVLSGFTVHVNDTNHSLTANELAALTTDVRFAANDWLSHFDNKGVIDIEVNIGETTLHTASGKAAMSVLDHIDTIDTDLGLITAHC